MQTNQYYKQNYSLKKTRDLELTSLIPKIVKSRWLMLFLCFISIVILGVWYAEPDNVVAPTGILVTATIILFFFFRLKWGRAIAAIFIMSLFLRILVCFFLESGPRVVESGKWMRTLEHPAFLVFGDESFYATQSEMYADRTESRNLASSRNLLIFAQPYRVAMVMAIWKRLLGKEPIWNRLFAAILGAVTICLIVLACQKIFSGNVLRWCMLISVFGPQLIFLSCTFLKEVYCVFAAAICLYGMLYLLDKKTRIFKGMAICALGLIIMLWFRQGAFFILSFSCAFIILYSRHKSQLTRIIGIGLLLLMATYVTFKSYHTVNQKMTSHINAYSGVHSGSRIFTKVNRLRGPIRIVHVPILFFNPLLKDVYRVFVIDADWHRNVVFAATVIQWYIMAPWILLGFLTLYRENRKYFWLVSGYLMIWIVAAILRNGVNPEAARYRDALMPFAIVIFGFGANRYLNLSRYKDKLLITSCYFILFLLGFLFMIRDFM